MKHHHDEVGSQGDSPFAKGGSPFAVVQTPRLSIGHLMLWTLCTALYLTVFQMIARFQDALPSGYAGIQEASSVIQGIVSGAIFAGTLVLVGTRIRNGPPMLRHPGHWLLVVIALQSAVYLPVMVWFVLMNHYGQAFIFVYAAVMAISPVGACVAAWYHREFRWRLLFLLLAGVGLAQCVAYAALGISSITATIGAMSPWISALFTLQSVAPPLLAVAVLLMSIGERLAGQRRDWLHWAGIVGYLSGILITLLWMVVSWLIN